jgi:hypothetical protein
VSDEVEFRITSRTASEPRAQCAICEQWVPLELIMGHVRGAHGIDAEPSTWPDGELVIVDQTLEPGDFSAEGRSDKA